MAKAKVKNGTPVGCQHLCKRCSWGQFMTGYRESDLLVICMRPDPSFRVPFTVYECSEFSDRYRPTWEQMSKLAIDVDPVRISAETRGFAAVTTIQPVRVDEDEDEAGEGWVRCRVSVDVNPGPRSRGTGRTQVLVASSDLPVAQGTDTSESRGSMTSRQAGSNPARRARV